MRLVLLLLAASTPLTLSAAPAQRADLRVMPGAVQAPDPCAGITPRLARSPGGGLLRTTSEPITFDLHQAVVRRIDGCIVPAILRKDVDGGRSRILVPGLDRQPRTSDRLLHPLGTRR